jgi:hypothetical protein
MKSHVTLPTPPSRRQKLTIVVAAGRSAAVAAVWALMKDWK